MGELWEGCPSQVRGSVWGYNLKLITIESQKHPREKKWGGRVHHSPPGGNAPVRLPKTGRQSIEWLSFCIIYANTFIIW